MTNKQAIIVDARDCRSLSELDVRIDFNSGHPIGSRSWFETLPTKLLITQSVADQILQIRSKYATDWGIEYRTIPCEVPND